MCEELLCDLVLAQLVAHGDQQPLGFGVHITHIHSSLMMEKHMVTLTRGVDANIELLLLGGQDSGKHFFDNIHFLNLTKVTLTKLGIMWTEDTLPVHVEQMAQ